MVYTVYWHTAYRYNDNDICDILLREKPPLSWQGEPRQDSTPAITFGLSHRLLLLLLLFTNHHSTSQSVVGDPSERIQMRDQLPVGMLGIHFDPRCNQLLLLLFFIAIVTVIVIAIVTVIVIAIAIAIAIAIVIVIDWDQNRPAFCWNAQHPF